MVAPVSLYSRIREAVDAALVSLEEQKALPAGLDKSAVVLEAPRDISHGDLSTNAAMVLAKPAGMNPREIAEPLAEKLKEHPAIAEVSVAGPGFVNIRLTSQALLRQAMEVEPGAYGTLDIASGRNALVEYLSINPTGPIHVGHGRNAAFGDAIANLLEKAGYPVYREYLMNDAGNQIRVLVRSLVARYRQLFGEDVEIPADGYPGEYLIEIAQKLKERDGDKWLQVTDEEALYEGLREFAVASCMALIKADIGGMGIKFDNYFSEYAMHQTDRMEQAVIMLREKGLVYEGTLPPPKGKEVKDYKPVELTLFKATEFGLPDDQPIYNREGKPTYFGQDIAYHWDKLQRGFDYLPVVIGAAQAGSFRPLKFAVETLAGKPDVYHPIAYDLVKVMRDGKPVTLSKRAGNIVALKDVLAEIGSDVFRFLMLMVKPTTVLVFDLAKAAEKSMENPVFYVQYAHARVCAVERQRHEMGLKVVAVNEADAALLGPAALKVLCRIMLYPSVIEQAARKLEPHRLAFYAQELAGDVHRWYADEKFLEAENPEATAVRLQVAAAARGVLADALRVCGVNAPEQM